MKYFSLFFICLVIVSGVLAQKFTRADTLRGSDGPGRAWWNVTHYDLHVNFNIKDSTINGHNVITFHQTKKRFKFFQIDLQEPLTIDSVIVDFGYRIRRYAKSSDRIQVIPQRRKLYVEKEGNAWFARLDTVNKAWIRPPVSPLSDTASFQPNLTVYFHGKPQVAKRPPWDGGMVWTEDSLQNPFVSVACQGTGASIWFPNKDYQGDEPDDGATMHFTAPDSLMIVSNGRMIDSVGNQDGTHTITWEVKSPINNYEIIPYIGKYVHFAGTFGGEDGPLTMDYWVLKYNLKRAVVQFKQAPEMMRAFEHWFGAYPFYKDGYKLVEAPFLGMENQSAVAYGNHYRNGYLGRDLSGTGWGLKWDFIIVHESGHEWFGNNITTADIADMWVHEGFTNYSEALFTEYFWGKKAGQEYVIGTRKNVRNDRPIVGSYGVNEEGSGDMYYKGGNMIHAIRQIINDDDKFRQILRGMNQHFRHQIVTGKEIQRYINEKSGYNFDKVFEQYLETTNIPVLEYRLNGNKLQYRWSNCVEGFDMPVRIYDGNDQLIWIFPTDQFQESEGIMQLKVDKNFYVLPKKIAD